MSVYQAKRCRTIVTQLLDAALDERYKASIINETIAHALGSFDEVFDYFSTEKLLRDGMHAKECVKTLYEYKRGRA